VKEAADLQNRDRQSAVPQHQLSGAALVALLALLASAAAHAGEPISAFRAGDELVVSLGRLDVLRQAHRGLTAALTLRGDGKDRDLLVDLDDEAVQGALVVDLAEFGRCDGVSVTVRDSAGQTVAAQAIAPIPQAPPESHVAAPQPGKPTAGEQYAYIEPGTAMRRAPAGGGPVPPRIVLPDVGQLRRVSLEPPSRRVAKAAITFPVVSDTDFPLVGGAVVSRQTAAPDDPSKASLYLAYKKAIYEGQPPHVARWRKFLVEVPIQRHWADGQGDERLTLAADQFEVHLTEERAPSGRNMLGEGDGDLGQKGEIDTDDRGRIYWRVEGGGAYVVRFDPKGRRFEQPPVPLEFQKLVPDGVGLLDESLCRVTCARGRVFLTLCSDTLSSARNNPHPRRIGGVFSIPQDRWDDAAAFAADIRLHAGSWESARPALYKTPPKPDTALRKLGACVATQTGCFLISAGPTFEGGPWRLDVDEKGNTTFFSEVRAIGDPVAADGTPLPPTRMVLVNGIPKGRVWNPLSGGGRSLLKVANGEITLPRGSVRLLLLDGPAEMMAKAHASIRKGAFQTYDGAPQGTLTIQYDLVEKLKKAPQVRGAFAASLSGGPSLGPAFLVSAVPGEADTAVAVCEYTGYPLSVLDFSALHEKGIVRKRYLPATAPTSVGLGPYCSRWVRHGDELWLYVNGYTGMSRVQYARGGKALTAIAADVYGRRLAPEATDGYARAGLKKVDGLLPVFGGRLIDTGYGIGGRGGTALSTGLCLFDPRQLSGGGPVPAQTAAYLSRCFALNTLRSRLVWNARDGSRRQEVFGASGSVRRQFINELAEEDKALAPSNLDAKVFCYEVAEKGGLRDLYGFSLPPGQDGRPVESHIALSPCNRFLVILTQDGVLYSWGIAHKQFTDGLVLTAPSGAPVQPMEFHRPSEFLFASPDGQLFVLTAPLAPEATAIQFSRIAVDAQGRLSVHPHLAIAFEGKDGWRDLDRVVRCFMPDLKKRDGSYDFILGYSQSTVAPFVRVISDFISP